jgi:hypothetical protein
MRVVNRDREGNDKRETEIAVVFTVKPFLSAFLAHDVVQSRSVHDPPNGGSCVVSTGDARSGRSIGERTAMQPAERTRQQRPPTKRGLAKAVKPL